MVAPLNWGIGHATRMVPLIRTLLSMEVEVLLGSEGAALSVLQQEFPSLNSIELPAYNIHYSPNSNFTQTIALQLPKIRQAAVSEHQFLKKIIKEYELDGVISDSRIGLYSDKVPTVFVAHQLFIQMPRGKKWLESSLKRLNLQLIGKFDECWIPDYGDAPNLSGDLSHKHPLNKKQFKFIGPLSRLKRVEAKKEDTDLLILLSGLEPQRTLLEDKILNQLSGFNGNDFEGKVILARGRTDSNENRKIKGLAANKNIEIEIHDYLDAQGVAKAIARSKTIVCRSGYSTLMDLVKTTANTNKKVILVPTPGQTEQEYLADYFAQQNIFYSIAQEAFQLKLSVAAAQKQSGWTLKTNFKSDHLNSNSFKSDDEAKVSLLEQVLTDWKKQLCKKHY